MHGNYDRVAGTLDPFAKGALPPEPEVVRTPATGMTLTHRVGSTWPGAARAGRPDARSRGEPAVNDWLADRLPAATDVACTVVFPDRSGRRHRIQ